MSFRYHINNVVTKANRMLGFVRRNTKCFRDSSVLISLYRSLVLSKLEYCSSVWAPSQAYLINKIERTQKRTVKWLAFQTKQNYRTVSYPILCKMFGLTPLHTRQKQLDLRNFNKIVAGHVNCPYLLSQVCLIVPRRALRRTKVFDSSARLCVRKNTFLPRIHALAETLKNDIDLFEPSATIFKRTVSVLNFD